MNLVNKEMAYLIEKHSDENGCFSLKILKDIAKKNGYKSMLLFMYHTEGMIPVKNKVATYKSVIWSSDICLCCGQKKFNTRCLNCT